MDWLLATPQLHSAFSSLGALVGDTYVVSPDALAILEEINYKLIYEDQTLRTFRRAIAFGQNVRSDLIPVLENTKDDAVLESVIRLLVNLTVPVECLFSVDVMYRTEMGRHTIFELNKLLYNSKEAFTDPKSTKSVVEYMKHILDSETKLSPQKCDQINNCLLLLRNILHIPETNANFIKPMLQSSSRHGTSMQNTILWNLFIQSIDKMLLYLMTCPQRALWGVTMVQLIALIYKDQHISTLQKLLNLWFEASLSESSEDNESNTTPPKQGSGDYSPMLTSDPTSDCSEKDGDERRQTLREGTDATLQEVSRKGQEYQDAMFGVPAKKLECAETSSEVTSEAPSSPQQHWKVTEPPEPEKEMAMAAITEQQASMIMQLTQPADNAKTTTNTTCTANQERFKQPPPLPVRPLTCTQAEKLGEMADETYPKHVSAVKRGQKSPHSGQLHLTKGKCFPQKRECASSQSELSDCGYGTQVENQESISTSSNDDDAPQGKPQHQKPPCNTKPRNKQRNIVTPLDKKEQRRKKLVKRSKSNLINMKGLCQHTPTDDDISNLLKEFTVDFLLKGYNYLVKVLHLHITSNAKVSIDTSHFFWLVAYFLKFAAQLELDMEHIDTILNFDVLTYLTSEGVSLCEQLELNARQEGSDLKPYLRRMHLVVTAIREFLQAIETYSKVTHLSEDDRTQLLKPQIQISAATDLRSLFVLLLRRFNPSIHSKQYLQDLVVTNHKLMLVLDRAAKLEGGQSVYLTEHLLQFATPEVMHYYGILLEDFNYNGEFLNDCIFTMMHHIGGDLKQIGVLFQPIILKTFSRLWETDNGLCDDWTDLIAYVIRKFMSTPPKSPLILPNTSLTEMTKEHNLQNNLFTWTQEDMDTLYWYYVQSKKSNDVVGKIVKLFSNNGNKLKSRISIIQQLLAQDMINLLEYDDLMKFEEAEYQRSLLNTPTSGTNASGLESGKPSNDTQMLLDLIIKDNKQQHLIWLQQLLLECCYIKLKLRSGNSCSTDAIMEPVAYHCILMQKSIPIVQWNNDQSAIMLYQPFVLLLHKLGIQLPADAGTIFARIPDYWTPETMYGVAKKLGTLDKLTLKFDPIELEVASSTTPRHCMKSLNSLSSVSSLDVDMPELEELPLIPEVDAAIEKAHEIFVAPKAKNCNSIIRYTPDVTPAVPNWLQLVMRSKCIQQSVPSRPATDISDCTGADDESMHSSSQQAPTQQLLATSNSSNVNHATTLGCQPSIIGAHNDNSSSSGCGGTDSSQSMAAVVSNTRTTGNNTPRKTAEAISRKTTHMYEDAAMKSFQRLQATNSHFSRANNLEQQYSALVASIYENEMANCDNISMASDLEHMYVSDEEDTHENHEQRVPYYH
uniref:Timeless protein n=1 Tax=Chymomyza costata TaxID=76946 RepID=Q8MML1_9MUSC|nr:timeless protein [Chymomyza costata]